MDKLAKKDFIPREIIFFKLLIVFGLLVLRNGLNKWLVKLTVK